MIAAQSAGTGQAYAGPVGVAGDATELETGANEATHALTSDHTSGYGIHVHAVVVRVPLGPEV